MTNARIEISSDIYRLLRRMQRANRAVGPIHGTTLNLSEIHFLIEVGERPGISQQDLAEILALEKSTISRYCARLEKAECIRRRAGANDARVASLELSSRGRKIVAAVDTSANEILERISSGLSKAELGCLVRFFHAVADGAGAPGSHARKGEHPLRSAQRRVTRALGLQKNQVLGTDLTVSGWHVLSEIRESVCPLSVSAIRARLALSLPALSLICNDFVGRGFIRKTGPDGRRPLVITAAGIRHLDLAERSAGRILNDFLARVSNSDLVEFRTLLELVIGDLGYGAVRIDRHVVGRVANGDAERSAARAFMARAVVERGWESFLPASIVGPEHVAVSVFRGADVIGVAQVENVSSSETAVTCAGCVKGESPGELLARVVKVLTVLSPADIEVKATFPPISR